MKDRNKLIINRMRVLPAVMAGVLLVFVCGCDEFSEFLDRNKNPESIAIGLPGIWEVTGYELPENSYRTIDTATGEWYTFTDPSVISKIDKSSPYYSIIKITESNLTALEGGKIFDAELDQPYYYDLKGDSVIESSFFKSDYEICRWRIAEMKAQTFLLERFEEGAKLPYDGAKDTVSLGSRLYIRLRRLK